MGSNGGNHPPRSVRAPPGSPRGGDLNLQQDDRTKQEDNWVLATIDAWISSGRCKEDIVLKVMKSFSLEDLKAAALHLRNGHWCVPDIAVPYESSTGAGFSRTLAERVHDGLASLQNQAPLKVNFWVPAQDLLKVPGVGPFPDQLEEPEVAARLGDVDMQLKRVLDKLESTVRLESTVAGLVKTVDLLQQQLKEQQKATAEGNLQKQSYAKAAGRGRLLTRTQELTRDESARGRSASTKRVRDGSDSEDEVGSQRMRLDPEVRKSLVVRAAHPQPKGSNLSQDLAAIAAESSQEFVEVVRRKKKKVERKMGSSTVQADGGIKPPYSVFLSGTSPATTVEVVKEKLSLCAEAMQGEGGGDEAAKLKVLSVVEIKLKIPPGESPRHRCWKVQVEPQFSDHMSKAEAYPAAWSWRRWNNGPRRGFEGKQGEEVVNVGA